MWKNVLAVVAGYVAMLVIVFGALALGYAVIGSEGAFEEGSYRVSVAWTLTMLVAGFVAAVVGGVVCAKIAPRPVGAVFGLMILVAVMGTIALIGLIAAPQPDPAEITREAGTPMGEAMTYAEQPVWFAVVNPVVGLAGVWIGGMLVARKGPKKHATTPMNE